MKIVFLDIDGVLNCEGSRSRCVGYRGIDDKKAENLAKIVKATGAGGFSRVSTVVEYRYLNYEVSEVESEYEKVVELLAKAQMALDLVNNSQILEINL